jgi:hypothetical protein
MKNMKDKRGFLLGEETVKIIIAVICIVFLVFLLVLVYLSVSGSQQSKEAKASMNLTREEIQRVNAGGAPRIDGTLIPNPSGWRVFSFIESEKKPNLCAGTNCLCICQKIWVNVFGRQLSACDKQGACFVISNIKKFDEINIENDGTFINIQKINGFIYVSKHISKQ